MSIQPASKIVLVHTHEHKLLICGHVVRESVAQTKRIDGCVECWLIPDLSSQGQWAIHCEWITEEAMNHGVQRVFKRVFEELMAKNALRSLRIVEFSDCYG